MMQSSKMILWISMMISLVYLAHQGWTLLQHEWSKWSGKTEKSQFKVIIIDEEENQLYATQHFIALVIGSTCVGHHYAHRQELAAIPLITTCAVWQLGC
jgi:hypothetical protein